MKKRVLVLGATGLIGHQVYNYLKDTGSFDLCSFAYRKRLVPDTLIVDARDESRLIAEIAKIAPDYIVNCIGILISGSVKEPENAIFLNTYLPIVWKTLLIKIIVHLYISRLIVCSRVRKVGLIASQTPKTG